MYRMRIRLITAVAVAGLVMGLGCAKKSSNDDALMNSIKAKLSSDPATSAAKVNVAVKDGVATLSGDVPSSDVALAAVNDANGTSGVARVDNQIKVNPSEAANQPPPNTPVPGPASTPAQATAAQAQTAPAPTPANTAAPAPPKPVTHTFPAGTRVSVRMIDSIDSGKDQAGQTFRASLSSPLVLGDRVIVPAGAPATVTLESVKSAGRVKGSSELSARLTSLESGGRAYDINSEVYSAQGKGRGKQTAVRTGVGAAAGAIIGAIAGGGKGAAIGAGVGGGGAAGYQLFTHGQQVKIPSETIVTFRLSAPLTVRKAAARSESE